MLLCNPLSLRNKLDELRTLVGVCYEYRESGLLVFTEIWLRNDVPDNLIQIDGFSQIRSDRDENSGKTREGGVCVYINDSWCHNFAMRQHMQPLPGTAVYHLATLLLTKIIYQHICVLCIFHQRECYQSS